MKSSFSDVDQIHDMTIKETETSAKKSAINAKIHPGFMCFFQQYLDKASITFNQCMQALTEGATKMPAHLSTRDILKLDINPDQKIQMLNEKTKENRNFLYFFKNPSDDNFISATIDKARERKKHLQKMQNQLKFCESYKQNIMNQRLEEFQLKRKEEERIKRQQEQQLERELEVKQKMLEVEKKQSQN